MLVLIRAMAILLDCGQRLWGAPTIRHRELASPASRQGNFRNDENNARHHADSHLGSAWRSSLVTARAVRPPAEPAPGRRGRAEGSVFSSPSLNRAACSF